MKKQVGVIGSGSMVGSRFCELSSLDVVPADYPKVDILKKETLNEFFKNSFEWVILFSAFTNVDEAEKQRGDKNGSCWQINVEGLTNVVEACKAHSRKLVFISTEFVFDGTGGPYPEIAATNEDLGKMGWYGITKFEGEKIVARELEDSLIVRITYPYRGPYEGKKDFVKIILRKFKEGTLYPMFDDQIWTPTFVDDLAPAMDLLVSNNLKGIYHVVSPSQTTPYMFARELAGVFGLGAEKIEKGSLADFLKRPGATPRPTKGGLVVDKIIREGFTPTDWQEGIREIFKQSGGN